MLIQKHEVETNLRELVKKQWQHVIADKQDRGKLQQCYRHDNNDDACCVNVLMEYFTTEKKRITQSIIKMKKQQNHSEHFSLKKNVTIYLRSHGMHVTGANLTDDLAIAILKENPKRLPQFETVHPDVHELMSGNAKPQSTSKQKENPAPPADPDATDAGGESSLDGLENLSMKDLKAYAADNGLNEKEYSSIKVKAKMIEFIKSKF